MIQHFSEGDILSENRINEMVDGINAIDPSVGILMINTTYVQLKQLRDNSQLKPGQQYRITDYECTTSQADTQSAGHQFDIIVTADSSSTLNENARAALHEGDTYFSNPIVYEDSGAWPYIYKGTKTISGTQYYEWQRYSYEDDDYINNYLYTLENSFSNSPSGIDPNEYEYYKNWYEPNIIIIDDEQSNSMYRSHIIIRSEQQTIEIGGVEEQHLVLVTGDGMDPDGTYRSVNCNLAQWELKYSLNNIKWSSANGKGTIYYMKDDFQNEAFYDFKNIQFKRCLITGVLDHNGNTISGHELLNGFYGLAIDGRIQIDTSDYGYFYTFSNSENMPTINDDSITGNSYNNKINYYAYGLNNIVLNANSYGNTFGTNCCDNTFGNWIERNTFGNGINYNTFGNGINYNTFGNEVWHNTFGNSIYNNTFGNGIGYNTFGNVIQYNTFGNYVYYNTFGNYVYYNTFGNSIYNNTFGNYIRWNTFGNWIERNTFGNGIGYNTFGNWIERNTFGNSFYYNFLENDIVYLNLSPENIQHVHFYTGLNKDSLTTISGLATNVSYVQFVAKNSSGQITVKTF